MPNPILCFHLTCFRFVPVVLVVAALVGLLGCSGDDGDASASSGVETACSDEVDNDGDGDIDCNDTNCVGTEACPSGEVCSDGMDNDGDDAVDCEDSDCAQDVSCKDEVCDDGVDNNGDEAVDCADPGCAEVFVCACATACEVGTSRCTNGDVETCEAQGDALCPDWAVTDDCSVRERCVDTSPRAFCAPGCEDVCVDASTRCNAERTEVEVCERAELGCLDWLRLEVCPEENPCVDVASGGQCLQEAEACEGGATRCTENGEVEACLRGDEGLLGWEVTAVCGDGERCIDSGPRALCLPACEDACVDGATRCNDDTIELCRLVELGCLAWTQVEVCMDGMQCDDSGEMSRCVAE